MARVLLGWPSDGPTLRLDYRQFSYAGKFVMSNTGKAVIREPNAPTGSGDSENGENERESEFDEDILAAVAFNADRTDPETLWLRYVTVRNDRRGEGLGPELCLFLAGRAAERGYGRLRIAVNNPFAYEALYRAGFAYTDEETGLAELVLERPADTPKPDRSEARYQRGLDAYRDRDLSEEEHAFLDRKRGQQPPELQ
jgi:GNAT superfamily N-acetyltransferase